jgi:hypothetical protein
MGVAHRHRVKFFEQVGAYVGELSGQALTVLTKANMHGDAGRLR